MSNKKSVEINTDPSFPAWFYPVHVIILSVNGIIQIVRIALILATFMGDSDLNGKNNLGWCCAADVAGAIISFGFAFYPKLVLFHEKFAFFVTAVCFIVLGVSTGLGFAMALHATEDNHDIFGDAFYVFSIVMCIVGGVSTVLLLYSCVVELLQGKPRDYKFHVFLGYKKGDMDAAFVKRLHTILTQNGLAVFVDVFNLPTAQLWDENFCKALMSSYLFVPIISREGQKKTLENLHSDSACDNMLMEWVIALELKDQNRIKGILPIFVGRDETQFPQIEYVDYFTSNCSPAWGSQKIIESVRTTDGTATTPEIRWEVGVPVVKEVMKKALDWLTKFHFAPTEKLNLSVKGVYDKITNHQGDIHGINYAVENVAEIYSAETVVANPAVANPANRVRNDPSNNPDVAKIRRELVSALTVFKGLLVDIEEKC
jgi:hypothetical protein